MPAAVVGIVAFAVLGFSLAGGWQAMTAQVTPAPEGGAPAASSAASSVGVLKIRITTNGFQPANATGRPGQKITWTNEQSIPHILTSQTLRDNSGAYLNTPAIFPGGNASFIIGETEPDREHTITSTTDELLIGTVTVSAAVATSSKSSKQPLGSLDGVNLPSGQGSSTSRSVGRPTAVKKKSSSSAKSIAALGGSSASAQSGQSSAAVAMHSAASSQPVSSAQSSFASTDSGYGAGAGTPLDAYAPAPSQPPVYQPAAPVTVPAPVPVAQDPYPQPLIGSVIEDNYAPPSPQPLEGPHTGPGLWVVSAMSIALLWYGTKKYFMRAEDVRA